jgi:phosphoglycerate kinase
MKYSLRPVVDRLRTLLGKALGEEVNVAFAPDCIGEVTTTMARQLESGQVLLLENLRFHAEEEANDPAFSKELASLADVYVNDAFGSAHRAHASTEGITHFLRPADGKRDYLSRQGVGIAREAFCGYHRRLQNLRQD